MRQFTCPKAVTHPSTNRASFPEKLLKIVATRGEIFSLKFTKYRLADPLGELKRSPRPPSRNKGGGATSKGRGREGRGGETLLQGVRGDRRPCLVVGALFWVFEPHRPHEFPKGTSTLEDMTLSVSVIVN